MDCMKALLVQLDEATYHALNKIAPAAKRRRSEFVRSAIRQAIREAEYARMRAVYEKHPDSVREADDWSNAEEYRR